MSEQDFYELDQRQILRMCAKMFSMLPVSGGQGVEGAQGAYFEELQDLPFWPVSIALDRILGGLDPRTRQPWRFVPPVAEIKRHTAAAMREWRRFNNDQDPMAYNAHGEVDAKLDVELTLSRVRLLATPSNTKTTQRRRSKPRRLLPEEIDLGSYNPSD